MITKAARLGLPLKVSILLVAFLCLVCKGADNLASFEPPTNQELIAFGEWATSGRLMFRVVKIAEQDTLKTQGKIEKAPGGARFVLVTLQVMPTYKGEASIDYPANVRLLDAEGQGYVPSARRFLELYAGELPVKIDEGTFSERVIPFLVQKSFTPVALRCTADYQSPPVLLALRME